MIHFSCAIEIYPCRVWKISLCPSITYNLRFTTPPGHDNLVQPLFKRFRAHEPQQSIPVQQSPKDSGRRGENPLTLLSCRLNFGVCRGFAISAAHNPGFPRRLAPGEGLLVLGCSTMARLAQQDELWDDELTQG